VIVQIILASYFANSDLLNAVLNKINIKIYIRVNYARDEMLH